MRKSCTFMQKLEFGNRFRFYVPQPRRPSNIQLHISIESEYTQRPTTDGCNCGFIVISLNDGDEFFPNISRLLVIQSINSNIYISLNSQRNFAGNIYQIHKESETSLKRSLLRTDLICCEGLYNWNIKIASN